MVGELDRVLAEKDADDLEHLEALLHALLLLDELMDRQSRCWGYGCSSGRSKLPRLKGGLGLCGHILVLVMGVDVGLEMAMVLGGGDGLIGCGVSVGWVGGMAAARSSSERLMVGSEWLIVVLMLFVRPWLTLRAKH